MGECSEADLKGYFAQYGTVEYIGIPIKRGKRANRGFVLFETVEQARRAFSGGFDHEQQGCRGHQIGTQSIRVALGSTKDSS